MRYRIKVVMFKDGSKKYYSQFKKWYGWRDILWDGTLSFADTFDVETREKALQKIDNHYKGAGLVHSIEFEYITK